MKQRVERPPHERADFRDVLPRRRAGVALDVNPWTLSELYADHHLALDHARSDRQRDIFAVPAHDDLRCLVAVFLQLINQSARSADRDAAERYDFVILFQAGLRGGLALEYSSHDRRELRRKIKRLDRDLVADRSGRQHVGELVAIPLECHRETVCQRQGGQLVGFLPRRNRLVVDLGDDVAFADAERVLRRFLAQVADHGRRDHFRQADKINDSREHDGENDVHDRAGDGYGDLGPRRNLRERLGVLIAFALERLAGEHLRQLHEAAGRDHADGVKDAVLFFFPENLAEADGELLHLHAAHACDKIMAPLVHKNCRAEQQQHGGNHVNYC